ncbi:hypothetical protein Vau01_015700 [Virgisporangium aurantiacum]|uniref:Uncharacterized protein n=1 Tax=Virgisporangium aurantiacum TaxID=175570 RepID=A0A8J4DXL9_9ACTN|nr:hypothetical protein Vau01_015700 [Virgisporangium aurantiacum]
MRRPEDRRMARVISSGCRCNRSNLKQPKAERLDGRRLVCNAAQGLPAGRPPSSRATISPSITTSRRPSKIRQDGQFGVMAGDVAVIAADHSHPTRLDVEGIQQAGPGAGAVAPHRSG